MSLTIRLKPGEKVVVNGGVLRNASARHPIALEVLNRVNFMREREILLPEDAITPLLKVIYWLQIAYIDPLNSEKGRIRFLEAARELFEQKQREGDREICYGLASAIGYAHTLQYAAALKALRDALPFERARLGILDSDIEAPPEVLASAGSPMPDAPGLDASVHEDGPGEGQPAGAASGGEQAGGLEGGGIGEANAA